MPTSGPFPNIPRSTALKYSQLYANTPVSSAHDVIRQLKLTLESVGWTQVDSTRARNHGSVTKNANPVHPYNYFENYAIAHGTFHLKQLTATDAQFRSWGSGFTVFFIPTPDIGGEPVCMMMYDSLRETPPAAETTVTRVCPNVYQGSSAVTFRVIWYAVTPGVDMLGKLAEVVTALSGYKVIRASGTTFSEDWTFIAPVGGTPHNHDFIYINSAFLDHSFPAGGGYILRCPPQKEGWASIDVWLEEGGFQAITGGTLQDEMNFWSVTDFHQFYIRARRSDTATPPNDDSLIEETGWALSSMLNRPGGSLRDPKFPFFHCVAAPFWFAIWADGFQQGAAPFQGACWFYAGSPYIHPNAEPVCNFAGLILGLTTRGFTSHSPWLAQQDSTSRESTAYSLKAGVSVHDADFEMQDKGYNHAQGGDGAHHWMPFLAYPRAYTWNRTGLIQRDSSEITAPAYLAMAMTGGDAKIIGAMYDAIVTTRNIFGSPAVSTALAQTNREVTMWYAGFEWRLFTEVRGDTNFHEGASACLWFRVGDFSSYGPPLAVTCPYPNTGLVSYPFASEPIGVTGGTPPYTFAVDGTLPAGLTLNGANGVISGTPTEPGLFAVRATDSLSQLGDAACTYSFTDLGPLSSITLLIDNSTSDSDEIRDEVAVAKQIVDALAPLLRITILTLDNGLASNSQDADAMDSALDGLATDPPLDETPLFDRMALAASAGTLVIVFSDGVVSSGDITDIDTVITMAKAAGAVFLVALLAYDPDAPFANIGKADMTHAAYGTGGALYGVSDRSSFESAGQQIIALIKRHVSGLAVM